MSLDCKIVPVSSTRVRVVYYDYMGICKRESMFRVQRIEQP